MLWRAVVFALPAGAAIWLIGNISFGGASLAEHFVAWLNPVGILLGLNGVILLAYVVAIPANEIVIPTILMLTVLVTGVSGVGEAGAGVMFEAEGSRDAPILDAGGWTAAHRRQPHAFQPPAQPVLDHDLHDLEGDRQRPVGRAGYGVAAGAGGGHVLPDGADLATLHGMNAWEA